MNTVFYKQFLRDLSTVQNFYFLIRVILSLCWQGSVHPLAFIKTQNPQLKCIVCNGHLLILAHKEHTPYIKLIHKCSTYFLAFYKYILCRKSNRNYSNTQSLHTFQHSAHFVEEKVLLHSSWQNSLQCCLAIAIVLIEKTSNIEKKDSINLHTDTFTCSIFIAFVRKWFVATFGDRLLNYLLLIQCVAPKFFM